MGPPHVFFWHLPLLLFFVGKIFILAAISEQKKYKSTKKYISTKVLITQLFFELQTPDFARKFIWTVEPNDKVQKYKKYKSTKYKTKKYKNTKMQKNAKNAKSGKSTKSTQNKNKKTLERQLLAQ